MSNKQKRDKNTLVEGLSGYMLGSSSRPLPKGAYWWPYPTRVYICPNLRTAHRLLRESRKASLPGCEVWDLIYKVHVNKLEITDMQGGLYWTNQANRITVDRIVSYQPYGSVTDWQLLSRAKHIAPQVMRFINNMDKGER